MERLICDRRSHMKRVWIIITTTAVIGLVGAAVAIAAHDDTPQESQGIAVLDLADDGATLRTGMGDTVTIELDGNPTTGYVWEVLAIDERFVRPTGDPGYRRDSDLPGSAGRFTFEFEVVAGGESSVLLGYHRPWEDTDPLHTFEFTIVTA
jgi:predicted secreted protein